MTAQLANITLEPYQRAAAEFIKVTPRCAIFLDIGYGKTLTTLMALYELGEPGNILVVAPGPIARLTWPAEVKKFGFPLQTEVIFERPKKNGQGTVKRSKAERYELYEQILNNPNPKMYLINWELYHDLANYYINHPKGTAWPFSTIIIDEFQTAKSHSSRFFKALKKSSFYAKRFIGLTGSPSSNTLMDLWAPIFLLDHGKRLGKNITTYRETFFTPSLIMNNIPVKYKPIPGAEEAIRNSIKDVTIGAARNSLTLPPLTIKDHFITLDENTKDVYKELKKEMLVEIINKSSGEEEIDTLVAANAGVLTARLMQITSGTYYIPPDNNPDYKLLPDGTKPYRIIHDAKMHELIRILRNTNTPVIIPYKFRSDGLEIPKYVENEYQKIHGKNSRYGIEVFDGSQNMQDRWNSGSIPAMLIQPASYKHGINLQAGGHTIIWYTLPWALEEYEQTNGRLYRKGQERAGL